MGHEMTVLWNRWRILLTILIIIFVVETGAMFLLPVLLPSDIHPWIEAVADAMLLSMGSLPLLWFLLIQPMHAETRKWSHHSRLLMAALDEHALVTITDAQGRIIHANDSFCQISKFPVEEVLGQDHRIVSSGDHSKSFMKDLWDTIKRGEPWHGDVCNCAKDGSRYWSDTTIVPFRDETGRMMQYVALRADITERVKAQEALKISEAQADAANHAKSGFLANMSHEIRTPMTAILGFAENLLDADQSESESLNCIYTIRHNGEYLLGIINDILDHSKIEAGKMVTEQIACKPCQIIADVASLVRARADAKGLAFNIDYIGAIPETIVSDPTRMRQILINLIGNAIKFTEEGAVRLIVRVVGAAEDDPGGSPKEPYMQFDVLDTGMGMTDEQAAVLFQPFTQADTTTTRKFGGTGLGLTISKRFAELLGGEIRVVDSEVGVGTRFRATVATGPLEGVTMLQDPMSSTVGAVIDKSDGLTPILPTELYGIRILLAEDNPTNQVLLVGILKKAGAEIIVVKDGKLALDAALAARDDGDSFDVVLMDMQMPVMDGYEATGRLRQKGYTGAIIALTAHAMASDREKCIKAGCDDYATKPINRTKLIGTIRRHSAPAEAATL